MSDSMSMAFLVLLESLSPIERAVFLLREAFGYDYEEIAGIVEKSEANCRQIFARARGRIDEGRPRFESSRAQREELARRFMAAADGGDVGSLLELLAPDVVFLGDGGGKAQALGSPMYGREQVARFLIGLFRRGRVLRASFRLVSVNGQPGAITFDADGRVVNVFALDVLDGVVQAVRSVVNPDKLGHLGPVSDVARLPSEDLASVSWPPTSPKRPRRPRSLRVLRARRTRGCARSWRALSRTCTGSSGMSGRRSGSGSRRSTS
jgi:RNA polymerase sigma-70 factor (ECF subfamily)